MSEAASALQPAIEMLENDLTNLERKANGLLTSINLLRERAGLPPRPGGWSSGSDQKVDSGMSSAPIKLHSDTFTGKKLGTAVRDYLTMRKDARMDAPATSREIFDALKQGGFVSGAKDDATGLVVLRTLLRKNTTTFAKLQNGKYGLRAWYPNLRVPKGTHGADAAEEPASETDAEYPEIGESEEATLSDEDSAAA